MPLRRSAPLSAILAAMAVATLDARAQASPPPPPAAVHGLALPGAPPSGVGMDYIAYDAKRHRVWVPAGNTGRVDVVDTATERITAVEGFPTATVERNGNTRTVGPSSAAVGEGVVYVGNRGDSSVCAVDAVTLRKGACLRLASTPDGLAYVPSTKELWVTTPRDRSLTILDAAGGALAVKARIPLDGQPEGFAVDDGRGVFYTNLEDGNRTLSIDVRGRAVKATWTLPCGEDGPRGLALDARRNRLFVACTDKVALLDAAHGGALLDTLDTGAGVDDISYVPARSEVYAAAGRAARLTVAVLDDHGKMTRVSSVATAPGARNAVVTEAGVAYVPDSPEGKLLVVPLSAQNRVPTRTP